MFYHPPNAIRLVKGIISDLESYPSNYRESLARQDAFEKGEPHPKQNDLSLAVRDLVLVTKTRNNIRMAMHEFLANWMGRDPKDFAYQFQIDANGNFIGITYHCPSNPNVTPCSARLPVELMGALASFDQWDRHPLGDKAVENIEMAVDILRFLLKVISSPYETEHGILETDLSRYWHNGKEIYPTMSQAILFKELLQAGEHGVDSDLAKELVDKKKRTPVSDAFHTKAGEVLWSWIDRRNNRYIIDKPVAAPKPVVAPITSRD